MNLQPTDPLRFLPGEPIRVRPHPVYRVMLQSNPAAGLMHVVRTIMELTRFCREEATYKMWQAYYLGQSCLLTTHRERAELYVEQFADRGLNVTIENS